MNLFLHLSTFQSVLLIIVAVAVTLFFLLWAVAAIIAMVLVGRVKKVVVKAESAIDSVEAAGETIKNIGAQAGGPLAIFKVIKAIIQVANRRK